MPNNPTVVIGSLNDDELKKSIDKLVDHVDKQLNYMVSSTKVAVMSMQNSLKSLGDTKIDFGGAANGGATKRTSKLKEEEAQTKANTQAIKENTAAKKENLTFDQQQKGLQTAMGVKSARDSFYAFAQGYKQQAQEIAQYIQAFESGLNRVIQNRLNELNTQLSASKEKIQKLNEELNRRNFASGNPQAQAQVQVQLDKELKTHNQIQKAIANVNNEYAFEKTYLASLYAEHHRISNIMRDETTTNNKVVQSQQEVAQATQQTAQSAQRYTEEIRKQAQAIRESKQWQEKGYATVNGVTLYNLEKDTTPLKSRISLEEQLLKLHKSEESSMMQQAAGEEKVAQATRLTEEELNKVYQGQKKVNEEINKRASGIRAGGTTPFQSYDSLRQSIASVLGIQEQQVKMANAEKDSYNQLSSTLKQLRQAYDALGKSDRNSDQGKALVSSIHEVERAIQKIRSQAARPVSLESIIGINGKGGLSEKTLDDITYKMQRLASYRSGLNVETQKNEINTVNQEYDRLKKKMDEVMQKNQQMIGSNNALGRSWNYMKNRLAFYFTVGAGTQFIKNLIDVRSQYEMNERALGILIDSAERGTQIFNELSQMALVSPYTLIELSSAAKQLTAYDVAARDVVDTTRRLADMAAAVGIPIERLTYALGQIKAYGYLNSRDARMFANAGIPLVKQLSEYYTELEGRLVSTADVYDRIKKKSIDYNEVMEVMYKMTDQGGKFFDFQAKMADTLKVRLANLTLAWNNMLNEMGKESQGVLTWGIGALRDLFLQWKKLDKLIKDAAWVVGIRTAFMLFAWACFKAGNAVGATTMQMSFSAVVGKRLAGVITTLWKSFSTLVTSRLTWFSLLAIAAVEATQAIFGVNEAQKALNESIRNGAKDSYDNISKFLEQYKEIRESLYATQKVAIGNIYNPTTRKAEATAYAEQQVGQDIDENEAKKAWEAVREQIELTVASSDKYIGNLLSISNMSERVRQGFNLLDDVQVVNAALKELDDDTIKVSKDLSAWWNAWQAPDGLIGNLKDYQETLNNIIAEYGTLESFRENTFLGGKGSDDLNDYETALERFRDDLQKTTDSIINFIELKGWSGDESKINQVFEQITQKLVTDNQLDPQKAFTLQTEVEEARSNAAKQALLQRINDEKEAYKISHDEQLRQSINADVARYNSWNETNGRSKVEWERFTKWLKEQHISETTAMFRNMDAEDIKSLNFQEGKHAEWVTRMVTQYAKEHKMSYDEAFTYLRSWVRNANQWSVFIPLYITTEDKKSVYDQLGEYDKAIDAADAEIERLTTRIDELRKKKELDKNETDELTRAEKELSDAQKAKADAEAKGGHGKKEKKGERASQKAAKQAESELAKALKDELSTIEKVRSIYKDLTKEGMSHADAVAKATKGWNETVNAINKVLSKNGMKLLNLADFVGVGNPREMMKTLQSQLESMVKRGASSSEIKVIQEKIRTLEVDADKYDLTKITKGLNNELDRLKEEYELAVALDADPELGGIFANYMGINLEDLPKTAEEAAKKAQEYIDKILAENNSSEKIDISSLMDKKAFDSWVESSGHNLEDELVKAVGAFRSYLHKVNVDETKNQAQEWNKLLEKYAEYEYKVTQIQKEAEREREVARKKGASQDVFDAINNRERQEIARVGFEEFQKSPEWITATGDLAGMTTKAIGYLISSLERYKKTAKNLDPKQIKQINSALRNLYRQQRQGNPFLQIADAIDRAKERAKEFEPEMKKVEEEIAALEEEIGDGEATEEQAKQLKTLKDRWKELAAQGEVSATEYVEAINASIAAASQAIGMFTDMAEALGGKNMTEAAKTIKDVTGILEKAGQGAAMGAQIGNGWGALIGGVAGGLAGVITTFAEQWSGNKAVTDKIKDSEHAVRKLELAMKSLEHTSEDAFGAIVVGSKQSIKATKELQLAELRRQLALEQSRDSKYKDDERISELQGQILDLEYEVKHATSEIVNDLLGISSHEDFFEGLISDMINAFKSGEDAMEVFKNKWAEMIDSMVVKMILGQVLQQWVNNLEGGAAKIVDKYTKNLSEQVAEQEKTIQEMQSMDAGDIVGTLYYNQRDLFDKIIRQLGIEAPKEGEMSEFLWFTEAWENGTAQKIADVYMEMLKNGIGGLQDQISKKSLDATDELINYYTEEGKAFGEQIKDIWPQLMEQFGYKYGQDADAGLSALQQGIQGITEDTAGALEAITSGMSQQVYYQSTLLEQIRDAIIGSDSDIQLGVQGQILLQLQTSYQTQQAIQSILEGWSSPNGMSVRVEMV